MSNIFTIPATGYAMLSKDSKFTPIEFTRHSVGDNDILIEILYSGICHSDIHTAKDEWGGTSYPCIPGHEIAGQVIAVGKRPCSIFESMKSSESGWLMLILIINAPRRPSWATSFVELE